MRKWIVAFVVGLVLFGDRPTPSWADPQVITGLGLPTPTRS